MRPDYNGGSIVNLMSSLVLARGGSRGFYAPLAGIDHEKLRAHRNLFLLVIDGLGYDQLRSLAAPALRAHLVRAATSVFPSSTASAVTSFFTGLAPQQHGLTGWHIYFSELDSLLAVLPFRPRHGFPPLAEPEPAAKSVFDHALLFDRFAARSRVVAPRHIIHSTYNIAHTGNAERRPYESRGELFDLLAAFARSGRREQFVYAYYPEIDRLAHEHGISSEQVAAEVGVLDREFARLLDRIEGTDTAIVITADHGFIDCPLSHQIDLDRHPHLVDMLRLPLAGEQRVAYCYLRPSRRDEFVDYVSTNFAGKAFVIESSDLVAQGYFGLGEAHPRLIQRVGDLTLLMEADYVIKDWMPGEPRYAHIGFHGGLSRQEMLVPVIVATA